MSDVRLFNTSDGGEVEFVAGQPAMDEGLETAVYLSLFGGNEEDSGLPVDDKKQWWGNLEEPDASKRYRSEVQNLIAALPAITGNLKRIEDAALRDVAWLVESGVAESATCSAGIPAINWIQMRLELVINGRVFPVEFSKPWSKSV